MRIAIDIRSAGGEKAGKGWYTFQIVQNLLKLDKKNKYILYTQSKIAGFDHFENAELKVINKKKWLWHLFVLRDLKKEGIDIFFAPSSYIIPTFLPKSIKSIITVHDLVAFLFPSTHNKKALILEKLFLKRAAKKATHITTVSENTKNDLLETCKIDEDKVDVVYCSASDDYKPLEKESLEGFIKKTNLPSKFFIALSTISPRKNYLKLLKAFKIVQKSHKDWHLIIVGKKGWQYEEIYQYVKENYLRKNVHFLNYLSKKSIIKLLNLARGMVFPSLYEGFGIPPLEAMKSGCPVIVSNSSSLPEVVGSSAIRINPHDEEEIARAMITLIKDDDLCEELRTKGFAQAKKFSWEASAKKMLEIINQI